MPHKNKRKSLKGYAYIHEREKRREREMAAYYYVSEIKRLTEELLTDPGDRWLHPPSRRMLEFAHTQVLSALQFSKRVFFTTGFAVFEILGAVRKLKEALESHDPLESEEAIRNLENRIHLFTQTMHQVEAHLELVDQLYREEEEEEEEETVSDGERAKMVGFSDQYNQLKWVLLRPDEWLYSQKAVSLWGMPGIGKTTLAREMFEDSDIVERFECRVWVRAGRKCGFKTILRRVLVELNPAYQMPDEEEDEADIACCLYECLKCKRYLIVLDDIWDRYAAACLLDPVYSQRRNEMMQKFPNEYNGSRILVISRLEQVGVQHDYAMEMKLMNKEESWHLLREKVFAQEWCSCELEAIGRKIAEKCDGLPLMILTVANLLSEADRTAEYWNEVANKKNHPLFKAAYDEILKVLLPSYKRLPRSLQICFMFLGVFPLYYKIPRSKLVNLWDVDGFLEHDEEVFEDLHLVEFLEELVSNSMVMIHEKTIHSYFAVGKKRIKTCRLHSSMWHLSIVESRSCKFCHVLDSLDDGFREDIESQPRLSFHNNVLFAIKDVHESVEENCASTVHSLFCYGPYQQYQVPLCFGLKLLNKLDALTIRFYEFPMEVLQLVELRYLTLTMNGNLPAAISQLSKLQFLIVHPHQSIKSSKESVYLPMEIWNLKELKHLQVKGKDLPNPCSSLNNLKTLSHVTPKSCTSDVIKAIPCLEKIGIQVELGHHDTDGDGDPFSCLTRLWKLESLKCVVVNPRSIPSFSPLSSFPRYLRKLSLNGLGYAWEEMSNLGSLPSLRILKLRNYAFRGPDWEVGYEQFPSLQSLVIEDSDLERWRIGDENFQIEHLIMKSCYKLKEIHGTFGSFMRQIEMVDCNPSGVEQMEKEAAKVMAKVIVSCSWYDVKPKE